MLNILDLNFNNLSDINVLEKVDFKELKELNLRGNNIKDINVLEKVRFKELNILDLSLNKINLGENNHIIINLNSKMKCKI